MLETVIVCFTPLPHFKSRYFYFYLFFLICLFVFCRIVLSTRMEKIMCRSRSTWQGGKSVIWFVSESSVSSKVFPDLTFLSAYKSFLRLVRYLFSYAMKVFAYVALILWFWRAPVAIISQQLVQPFGNAIMVKYLIL